VIVACHLRANARRNGQSSETSREYAKAETRSCGQELSAAGVIAARASRWRRAWYGLCSRPGAWTRGARIGPPVAREVLAVNNDIQLFERTEPARPSQLKDGVSWDREWLVAELHRARGSQSDWHHEHADRRKRPAHDVLVGIVKNLRAALFPSHFGGFDFGDEGIDGFVSATLDETLRALQEQFSRGLRYAPDFAATDEQGLAARASALTREFAHGLPRVRGALELDIRAAYEADPAAQSRSEVIFCYPGITAIIHHRLAHELYRLGAGLLARIVAEIAHSNTGIDIHPGAQIGESFFIDHGTGVVIGETAIIGKRVRLYQGVTLGARNVAFDERGFAVKHRARHPIVEDDVVIYAGATVLGRVTVGRGSTIGGNVWLTHSVPPHSLVRQARPQGEEFDDGTGI
jgi:serine O-acetyltransferase